MFEDKQPELGEVMSIFANNYLQVVEEQEVKTEDSKTFEVEGELGLVEITKAAEEETQLVETINALEKIAHAAADDRCHKAAHIIEGTILYLKDKKEELDNRVLEIS